MIVRLKNSTFYKPLQKKICHDLCWERFLAWRAGRRSGKSKGFRRWLLTVSLSPQRIDLPSFWVSPIVETARKQFEHFISDFKAIIGQNFNRTRRQVILPNGRSIFFVGCDRPESIEGEGAWVAVVDECRHIKSKSVVDEALTPMLGDAADIGGGLLRMISTPGFPGHWFSEMCDDIESQKLGPDEKPMYEGWHQFTTKTIDAGTIPEWVIENARRTLPPEIFARNYLAIETPPGSVVYAEFGEHNLVNECPFQPIHFTCGLDFGSSKEHPTAFIVVAHDQHWKNHCVMEERFLYTCNQQDVLKNGRELKARYGISKFICDHNRPDFVDALNDAGLNAVLAKKDVLEGIEKVRILFYQALPAKQSNLYLIKETTKKLQNEAYSYTWKENSRKLEPDKGPNNDHGLDALRYDIMSVETRPKQMSITSNEY